VVIEGRCSVKKRDLVPVRASDILGSPATKAIVIKELAGIGDSRYPFGLYLVQCIDDPFGILGHIDSQGYVYSGPPTMDGTLARYV
jgi:hypothetical protein